MKKEVLELPAECVRCSRIYDLNDDLVGEDWNKTIHEVLFEKFGSEDLVCPRCRESLRVIEEGEFKIVYEENKDKRISRIELTSKDGERRVWDLKNLNRKQMTFEIIE